MNRLPLLFECETSDPDDFLTLLWLADHPRIDLRAVVVTPGSEDQCQLIAWGLAQCGRQDVPIGAFHGEAWWRTSDGAKERVSAWHYKVFGPDILDFRLPAVQRGPELIAQVIRIEEHATVLVGSAPKNIGAAFRGYQDIYLARWVQQGFFAGDNLVPEEHRLDKFKGWHTCPSFNPGGDPKSALELLANPRITRRVAVSKNVCHGVVWTKAVQERFDTVLGEDRGGMIIQTDTLAGIPVYTTERVVLSRAGVRQGIRLMQKGFDHYLKSERQGQGKAMHDLVAAAVALDESVCTLTPAHIFRERGEWGARQPDNDYPTNARISTAIDMAKFIEVLAQ